MFQAIRRLLAAPKALRAANAALDRIAAELYKTHARDGGLRSTAEGLHPEEIACDAEMEIHNLRVGHRILREAVDAEIKNRDANQDALEQEREAHRSTKEQFDQAATTANEALKAVDEVGMGFYEGTGLMLCRNEPEGWREATKRLIKTIIDQSKAPKEPPCPSESSATKSQ